MIERKGVERLEAKELKGKAREREEESISLKIIICKNGGEDRRR